MSGRTPMLPQFLGVTLDALVRRTGYARIADNRSSMMEANRPKMQDSSCATRHRTPVPAARRQRCRAVTVPTGAARGLAVRARRSLGYDRATVASARTTDADRSGRAHRGTARRQVPAVRSPSQRATAAHPAHPGLRRGLCACRGAASVRCRRQPLPGSVERVRRVRARAQPPDRDRRARAGIARPVGRTGPVRRVPARRPAGRAPHRLHALAAEAVLLQLRRRGHGGGDQIQPRRDRPLDHPPLRPRLPRPDLWRPVAVRR